MRFCWEFYSRFYGWIKMVDAGINPNLAFLFSHYYSFFERNKEYGLANSPMSAHVGISGNDISLKMMEVFLHGPRSEYYKKDTLRSGCGYEYISKSMDRSLKDHHTHWQTFLFEGAEEKKVDKLPILKGDVFRSGLYYAKQFLLQEDKNMFATPTLQQLVEGSKAIAEFLEEQEKANV
jgi:hypothetical protein